MLLPELCLLFSTLCASEIKAQQIPPNAEPNIYGNGWTCKRGYRLSGGKCIEVQIPPNAELNIYGNGWSCRRGYRLSGSECVEVQIPQNAELNVYGNGWTCRRGYRLSGSECVQVQIPQNAELNVYGNGWSCQSGFKRVGDTCQKMNAAEIEAYRQQMLQMLAKRRQVVTSGNSYTTDRGAEFTVSVADVDLNCSEGFDGGFDRCEVAIQYSIATDYNGNDDPNVEVGCEAEIAFSDKDGFESTKSEDDSDTSYVSGQSADGEIEVEFSFSFEEAQKVRLTGAECEIQSVD